MVSENLFSPPKTVRPRNRHKNSGFGQTHRGRKNPSCKSVLAKKPFLLTSKNGGEQRKAPEIQNALRFEGAEPQNHQIWSEQAHRKTTKKHPPKTKSALQKRYLRQRRHAETPVKHSTKTHGQDFNVKLGQDFNVKTGKKWPRY